VSRMRTSDGGLGCGIRPQCRGQPKIARQLPMTNFFHGAILGKEVAVQMFIWPKILVQRQECVDLYIEVGGRSR
jgi:hypothetical protein